MYEKHSLHELRNMARKAGVKSPTSLSKKELIKQIEAIKDGNLMPYFTNKGRPPIESALNIELKTYIKQEIRKELQQIKNEIIRLLR